MEGVYKQGYPFLTLCSDTTLLTQGAEEMLGLFRQDIRGEA